MFKKIISWLKTNVLRNTKPEEVELPKSINITPELGEIYLSKWLGDDGGAFISSIPTAEEVAERQKKLDESLMFYDSYQDWYKDNSITPYTIPEDVYDIIKPRVEKYLRNSTAVYNNVSYTTESYWYKKSSKTGLKNLLLKFKKSNILLKSITEDEFRIIVKCAVIV